MHQSTVDDVVVNTIKTLSMDAIQQANSGHPGMPMGMADVASVLWCEHLNVDPSTPYFSDRDRFVLSAGHGSMLLYSLLHLSGFDMPLAQIKQFRQLHATTPGHPERHMTEGVETTTGPLGQGIGTAVGMAMAEVHLAARFNRGGFTLVDHFTYTICGDGCLMEGLSQEAASMAGHLGLGKLVVLYDDNQITIEGSTDLAFSENVPARFEAMGWQTIQVDGHDRNAVHRALSSARETLDKPTLISCRTHIGHGSPNKQGSSKAHGSPLGAEEIRLTKRGLGWPEDAQFLVPDEAVSAFDGLRTRGMLKRSHHEELVQRYAEVYPELAAEFRGLFPADGSAHDVQVDLATLVPDFEGAAPMATRACSGKVLQALSAAVPSLWGGSADLAGSNKTTIEGAASFGRQERAGRNLHFGIREHAMAAAMNGMAQHGGVIPYGGTFLCFSDYMRGAMRLSALTQQRMVYVLTHDSIFLGEDGPTHQSVEHALALRAIPNMATIRPADGRETAAAWVFALGHQTGPTSLLLTRQNLPQLAGSQRAMDAMTRGAYVLREEAAGGPCDIVLMATGSEVHLCVEAADILAAEGLAVRVVSVPCLDRFLTQDQAYQDSVLPPAALVRVSVEAGRTLGWQGLVGHFGTSIGLDRFGESAPAEVLAELFGFTTDNVVKVARETLAAMPAKSEAMLQALGWVAS